MTPVAVWDAKRAGWGMAGVSAGLVGLWVVLGGLEQLGQRGLRPFLETEYANVVFALLFPVVGAVVLARTPGHPLGALYCLAGFACALTLAVAAYGQRGLVDQPGSLPGAVAAGWVSSWIWMCGFLPLSTLGVLCFPDGRLPSRRWWPVAAGTSALLVVSVCATALRPGPLENHPVRDNPLGLPVPRPWLDLLSQPAWLWFVLACILASFAGLVTRYRHVASSEREPYHWFVVACALMVGSFAVPPRGATTVIANLLVIVAMPLLPLSVGIAVLRSRLPRSAEGGLRRSFVYAWLLAVELSVYAMIIVLLDALLRGHARPLVTLLGAGAVAVLFQPLRLRLQRSTDRMLFGDRGDPYAVLAGLGRRLEAIGAAEEALPATASAIAQALRLPYVAIELPDDQPHRPTAVHGTRPAAEPLVFELTHTGEDMGRLVVGRRHAREDLTESELHLLQDLARQVAVAAHAVLLDRSLRRSRDRLVRAREQERHRLQRDLHDGLGPTLAGLALGLAAARNVQRVDRTAADELLRDLEAETLGCVSEVRRILDDLRPAALDELGLVPALAAFAGRLTNRDDDLEVTVECDGPLPLLPAEVEVAAYRIATEAMTNVSRHANARSCRLVLHVASDLTLCVSDDGVGLPEQRRAGVGLPSMVDRAAELGGCCEVGPGPRGGTLVSAHLPVSLP